jgi:uncharacterized protein YkwD
VHDKATISTFRALLAGLSAGLVALAVAGPATGAQGGATPAPVVRAPGPREVAVSLDELEWSVVDAINAERALQGLPALVVSQDLCEAARAYSREMAEARFFGHVDPSGRTVSDRVESAGIGDWKNLGENIARNRGFGDPAHAAVREWMKSEPHRVNALSGRFRETGVGVFVGPDDTYYFTQIFMVRKR